LSTGISQREFEVREDQKASSNDPVKMNDKVQQRVKELNREMLRLPMAERRRRWKEYLSRIADLTKTTTREKF